MKLIWHLSPGIYRIFRIYNVEIRLTSWAIIVSDTYILITEGENDYEKGFEVVGIILGSDRIDFIVGSVRFIATNIRLNKTPHPGGNVPVPTDAASIEHGKHVATIRDCINCHGPTCRQGAAGEFDGWNHIQPTDQRQRRCSQ
jgi:hypothetical protein